MTWTVKVLLKMRSFLCTEEEVRLYPVSNLTISMRQASSAQSAYDKRLHMDLAIIYVRLLRKIPRIHTVYACTVHNIHAKEVILCRHSTDNVCATSNLQ
jgi:hypothetical protein